MAPLSGGSRLARTSLRAGALEQGLGDEEAEAEAAGLAVAAVVAGAAAGGDIGLADAVDDAGGEARAVVDDGDGDLVGVPVGADLDLALGEIDGVLDEVGEALDDRRIAPADRLGALALVGVTCDRGVAKAR